MTATSALLEVIDLHKSYVDRRGERVQAVRGVSLTIRTGEVLGLVGESGCGKTTLGRTILRLMEPTSGRILLDGQDFLALRGHALKTARRKIQMVFQDPFGSLNPRHKIATILSEPLRIHGFEDQGRRVRDLLDLVGLSVSALDRFPHEFSGGQRQRIAIARVFLKDAPILVLDEATSALDSEIEAAIQENLFQLMKGKTVIAIAHRLSTIAQLDRLVVIDKGRIVEDGPHRALVARDGLYAGLWARQSGGFIAGEAEVAAAE
jgi:ABC-type glutathione transport system ATPase component